jgi:hypothetical protein
MKKIFVTLFIILNFSCDDGNFVIASFEFEETVNYCDEYLLYRLSTNGQKETLMVTLTTQQIQDSDDPVFPVPVTENGLYTVTYRIFDEGVTSSYFCALVPPTEPETLENWVGIAGTIFVQNEAVYNDDETEIVAYNHIITIRDLVLESGEDKLKFDALYEYGEFQTPVD